MAFQENYLRLAKKNNFAKPWWIPKYTSGNRLSYQQAVHIPRSLQAATKYFVCLSQPTLFSGSQKQIQ
jgi:hypothetical protein